MSDTRELLRRGVGDYEPTPSDGYERVLRRRDHKRRNRRIASGLVAAAIVAIGVYLFASQYRTDTSPANPNDIVPPGLIVFSATDIDPGSHAPLTRESARDVYLIEPGTQPRRIVGATGDQADQFCPTISPDGTELAYLMERNGATTLVIAPVQSDGSFGSNVFVQTIRPSALNPCPQWASTGHQFAVIDGGRVATNYGGGLTWLGDVSGADEVTWSPDGIQVAVRNGSSVSIVPVAGAGDKRVVATGLGGQDVGQLSWSADGLAIGASEPAHGGSPSQAQAFIRIVDPSSGSTRDVPVGGVGWVDDVMWLPDGQIAYIDATSTLRLVHTDGETRPAVLDAGPVLHAVLSPDGRSIVYLRLSDSPSGGYALFSVSSDDGTPTQITPYSWGMEYADLG
jgi:WD40 repeat protein